MNNKEKLYTISEVAEKLNLVSKKNGKLATHTLRFWEKQFKQIKPLILNGNRRYYSNKLLKTLSLIRDLLKEQGMTINGVKKILKKDINSLDEYEASSIKAEYLNNNIKLRSKEILKKLKNLKNY
jgi:DNA-binding transcriptional MerR regulator|tara:strand:- start:712 stop:1086 length:375 start_codon:yes stop_codon:yes gene_type:complete